MPDDSSTPVKQPRRLTFRRMLLSLVLGLAAWWGVGWWLSPKPLYTLRYPVEPSIVVQGDPKNHRFDFQAVSLDRDGQYLLIQRVSPSQPDSLHWEARRLASGEILGSYQLDGRNAYSLGLPFESNWSLPSGDLLRIRYGQGDAGNQWSCILRRKHQTGQEEVLLTFPPVCTLMISGDAGTILQLCAFNTTPLLALGTPPWPAPLDFTCMSLSAGMVEPIPVNLLKVWSVPELRVRCSIWFEPFPNHSNWVVSEDGRWLVLAEAHWWRLLENANFNPKLRASWSSDGPDRLWCIDLSTGERHQVSLLPDERLASVRAVGDDLVEVLTFAHNQRPNVTHHPDGTPVVTFSDTGTTLNETELRKPPVKFFRLPRGPWVSHSESDFQDATKIIPEQRGQRLRFVSKTESGLRIWEAAPSSPATPLSDVTLPERVLFNPILIHGTDQVAFLEAYVSAPEWLVRWSESWRWLKDWIQSARCGAAVANYTTGEVVWRGKPGSDEFATLRVAGRGSYLIYAYFKGQDYVVEVMELPMKTLSPWWSRSAGLLVAALVLFARRRRRALSPY